MNWNGELVSQLKGREKANASHPENWLQQQIRYDQYHLYPIFLFCDYNIYLHTNIHTYIFTNGL